MLNASVYSYIHLFVHFSSDISSGSYQESLVRLLLGIEMLQVNKSAQFFLKARDNLSLFINIYFLFPRI